MSPSQCHRLLHSEPPRFGCNGLLWGRFRRTPEYPTLSDPITTSIQVLKSRSSISRLNNYDSNRGPINASGTSLGSVMSFGDAILSDLPIAKCDIIGKVLRITLSTICDCDDVRINILVNANVRYQPRRHFVGSFDFEERVCQCRADVRP